MKKIISALLMASVIAISAAGCGYNDALEQASKANQQTTSASQSASEQTSKEAEKVYKDSFDGLCSYMQDKGYYTDKAVKTEMDASFIGAKQGIKYSISNNLAIELYEYDTAKLNDTAKEIVKEVKESNSFTIIEGYPVNAAYLSDNGKYLMIYNDTKIDKNKPDKNSNEYKARENAVKDFLAFQK
jgi:predicted small lipoprotein YifL